MDMRAKAFEIKSGVGFGGSLVHRAAIAEAKERIAARFLRGHTGGEVVLNAHLDVRGKLGIDLALDAATAGEIGDAVG